MKNIWFIVSCILFIFLVYFIQQYIHLKEEKANLLPFSLKKESFKGGNYMYQLVKEDSTVLNIGFHSKGELKFVSNFPIEGYEQMISYHKGDGAIQSKLKIDTTNNTFGQAYYFYKGSGNLSSNYNYVNGIKKGSAVSYHDSSDHVKEVMLYNDKGELYYRKTFDWQGNHVKTEGSKY